MAWVEVGAGIEVEIGSSGYSNYDSAGESDYSSSSRSRDTKSLDNLSMAIYDGSYTGSSDSRWHSNGDGTYSFGNNDESNSSKYHGASSSGYSSSIDLLCAVDVA